MPAQKPRKAEREKPVNPPGYLATQDLKDRGWTPRLIEKYLGPHDLTRENGLEMGRRRLPPVKLYLETRVDEAERDDAFLAAQARAADAREKAAHNRQRRAAQRLHALEAAAASYAPSIQPLPLRKGARNKARAPHLPELEQVQRHLEGELGKVSSAESALLHSLLRARLDAALALAYDWFAPPAQASQRAAAKAADGPAKPSDWREWDWD